MIQVTKKVIYRLLVSTNKSVNQLANLLGGKRVHRDPVIEPRATLADNSKARELLGWKPTQNFDEWVINWKKELGI